MNTKLKIIFFTNAPCSGDFFRPDSHISVMAMITWNMLTWMQKILLHPSAQKIRIHYMLRLLPPCMKLKTVLRRI